MTQTLSSFFRKIFARFSGSGEPATPRVLLAAFGKHPGWDDHVEIGLDSEPLVNIRRILYVEGIGGHVESGAWDRLPENHRVAGFHHVFVCQTSDSVQIGRLWSSSDGKGRTRYPMIVCADCSAIPVARAVRESFPILEQIERHCTQTNSAEEVREAINSGQVQLRARLLSEDRHSHGGDRQNHEQDSPSLLATELARRARSESPKSLITILYQLHKDARDLPLNRPDELGRIVSAHPVHLRVPASVELPANSPHSILEWLSFLRTQLDGAVPILALAPLDHPWLDLFAGPPAPSHLYCMMATPGAVPLTTDIPYNLDEIFITQANAFLDSLIDHR